MPASREIPEPQSADTISPDSQKQWMQDRGSHQSIDSYYHFFHKAHPFAPTKAYMRSRIQSHDTSAISLYTAMSYVGCMFQQFSLGRDLKSLALQQVRRCWQTQSIPSPRHIYQVATLLLLTIVAYGRGELAEARDYLEKAVSLSIDIKMGHVDLIRGLRDKEYAEFWKRTYWYLYIMAETLQDTDPDPVYRLECPSPNFPLPDVDEGGFCYQNVQNSSQMTLSRLDIADFEEHAPIFSSLAYLITLVRTSRSIKRLVEHSGDSRDQVIVRADALLMNWKLHLPLDKQRVVTKTGEIDNIMLQSHILFHSLRIFVHTSQPHLPINGNELLHTRMRLEAAEAGVNLLTFHPCLLQMSPLNIKPLASCAVSGLKTTPLVEYDFHTRENFRLVLGALKQASAVWKTAELEYQALKAMARRAYCIPGVHSQAVLATSPKSPTVVLVDEVSSLSTDASYCDQYFDPEAPLGVSEALIDVSFVDADSGPSAEAAIFSWQF